MKWLKVGAVIFGAILVTALGIDAADTFSGSRTTLLGQVISSSDAGVCPQGMVEVPMAQTFTCVDVYEASADASCPHQSPQNEFQTRENLESGNCRSISKEDVKPWNFVSLAQAQQLCARDEKRLPTNAEWYEIASGMLEQSECITDSDNSGPLNTGSAQCVTSSGLYDVVGNVWEWVDEEVLDGSYNNRMLPRSGYVSLVDTDGVVVETSSVAVSDYNSDYAMTSPDGLRGIIRGGFYGSGEDAGIFAQNLSVPIDFKSAGIGFRCVK